MITEEILQQMRQHPGVYIIGDESMPSLTFPVVVLKPLPHSHLTEGAVFALEPRYPVSATAENFSETAFLAGGPYSVETPYGDVQHQDGLEAEADFFKEIALTALPHLKLARSLQAIGSAEQIEVSGLIEKLESYNNAHAKIQLAIDSQNCPYRPEP